MSKNVKIGDEFTPPKGYTEIVEKNSGYWKLLVENGIPKYIEHKEYKNGKLVHTDEKAYVVEQLDNGDLKIVKT